MRNLLLAALLLIIALTFSSCTRYDATTTAILTDLKIDFEITNDMPIEDAAGYMDPVTRKVYVRPGKDSTVLVLHEAIHMLRSDAGIMLDKRIEEVVACRGAYEIARLAGVPAGMSRYMLPGWINGSIELNGMEVRRLTEEEKKIIDVEIEKTIQLVIERLAESGKSMTDVDWAKTAIFLLL